MQTMSRRTFIKTAVITGSAMTLKSKIPLGGSVIELPEALAETPVGKSKKWLTVVSDVDAHSQCRMRVEVEKDRVATVTGDASDPESCGQLTLRGRYMKKILYAPDRLRYPLKRTGDRGEDKWIKITWNEAMSTIAERFEEIKKEWGAEAIAFNHGHYHSGDILGIYLARLANLIGTPNVFNPSHVCHLPRVFLEYGFDFGAVFPPDVPHAECLILWGGNPETTNKPQQIAIKKARDHGMKLIVVDPRMTTYAREADLFAQLRPGTDGALALGMLHVVIKENLYDHGFVEKWTTGFRKLCDHVNAYPPELVESVTWVPSNTIRAMARMYAKTRPAAISPRNALDQHTNASGAIRAINLLMAITGNLDVKGGNCMVIPIQMAFKDMKLYEKLPREQAQKKIGIDKCLYAKLSDTWPSAHTPSVWEAIHHHKPYPVKALMVMASNPALTCANTNFVIEALKKLNFLVVADLFMTPTAKQADIVLPASTFMETTRVVTYDSHADHGWNKTSRIAISPNVIDPLWESRPDWRIICDIGRKLGFSSYFPWKNEEEAIDEMIEPLGLTCEELKDQPDGVTVDVPPFLYSKFDGFTGHVLRAVLGITKFRDYPDMYKKFEMKGFNTPSGKIDLWSEKLRSLGYDPLPTYVEPAESPVSRPDLAREYPLILIAGSKLEAYTHSMMRNIPELRRYHPENVLEINPSTARGLKIADGAWVKVSSPRGEIQTRARLTGSIDPRVVHLFHGFEKSNCNILTDHKAFDPITGSIGLKSLLCKVEKI
jgi:anaerobic selenocysteine-containing dehydrogenase